jgi:hypothetical protein
MFERSPRVRKSAAVASAFLIGAAGGIGYWLTVTKPESSIRREVQAGVPAAFDPFVLDPNDPSEPLLRDGQLVTLVKAAQVIPFPLYRPRSGDATDESVSQVWVRLDTREVGIRYESGLRVYLSVWPSGSDPAAFYRQQVLESGVGSAETINGHPAYTVAAGAQAEGIPASSVVDITIGTIEVSLQGDLSLIDLRSLAEAVA